MTRYPVVLCECGERMRRVSFTKVRNRSSKEREDYRIQKNKSSDFWVPATISKVIPVGYWCELCETFRPMEDLES